MSNQNSTRRKYELKKRADEMAATRLRITKAAVALHGSIGPARTTLSAVAERAGVQRHTLYRHFPTELDLFAACSSHFAAEYPMPDVDAWRAVDDPRARLAMALDELYAYYEDTAGMWENVLRDAPMIEGLAPVMGPIRGYFDHAADMLMIGWRTRGRRRHLLAVAARHAVDFATWRSLTADGQVTRSEAVDLAAGFVEAAAAPRRRTTS